MSNIYALAQDAQRRTQRADCRCCSAVRHSPIADIMEISAEDRELLLLLSVVFLLLKSGANVILLLAIMYVIL